jgi:hypothetical protein
MRPTSKKGSKPTINAELSISKAQLDRETAYRLSTIEVQLMYRLPCLAQRGSDPGVKNAIVDLVSDDGLARFEI